MVLIRVSEGAYAGSVKTKFEAVYFRILHFKYQCDNAHACFWYNVHRMKNKFETKNSY